MTKKARGVYYTPKPVVDYIVRSTLTPLLEGKSPMQLAGRKSNWEQDRDSHPLTILDPACGSGFFLLGAYQFLLDWCLQWYQEHDREGWLRGPHPTIRRVADALYLRGEERQRIFRQHIFGVDIDEHAIDIAKRSLRSMMFAEELEDGKVEGEYFDDLSSTACDENVRCGNSLIGSDFDMTSLEETKPAIRAFDWATEFSPVIAAGGFDAIVTNPPYVNARFVKQGQGEAVKRYYRERYRCARRAYDLYVLFIERSQELLRAGGRAGMIVPNKIATLEYARTCRELLLNEATLDTITDVSALRLFQEANVYPYIITWTKRIPASDHRIRIVTADESECLSRAHESHCARVTTRPLSQCGSIQSGTTGFCAEQMARALQEQDAAGGDVFDFIVSGNIDRYTISRGIVRFMKRRFARPVLPMNADVLSESKRTLFANPKIVIAGMSRRLEAAFDAGGLALGVQVYAVASFQDDARFLLGVLNSKLMSFLLRTRFPAKRLAGGYLAINKGQLAKLPIRFVDEADRQAVSLRDRIIDIIDGLERPTAESDEEIDRLVYQLYALTADEVETVEQYPL
ncbi:MAG: N-6 DNA methylase [Planctomycetia bacterium]|nr:N-6 DNA methylase [Planctomycetia bacterium]